MAGFYLGVYAMLPRFLRRRIHPLEHAIQDFVRSARPTGKQALVLDAGAGEARFRPCFAGCRYLALDSGVGESAWDYSRLDLCADLSALPLADSVADVVLHIQVLEHVADPRAVLAEIHRVLRPGGRLYLTAPQGWHEHQAPNDHFRFTRFALRSMLEAAGFHEIRIEPMGGYFHYLGHRLTYIPKILFQERRGLGRILLFPLEFLSLTSFCFLAPLACYYLDRLDRKKEFTLCYRCLAVR